MSFLQKNDFNFDFIEEFESEKEEEPSVIIAQDDVDVSCPVVKVKDTRRAQAVLCGAFYKNPSKEFKLVGITGTNGKTTTTFLIKQILEKAGQKVGLIGTNQIMIGEEIYPAARTTPDSFELQGLFRKMADSKVDTVVMEVSSHSLVQHRVDYVDYNGAVTIKNLTIATTYTGDEDRAINVINKAATLTLDNVSAAGFKYPINVAGTSVGSAITINGGSYSGYAAMNITGNETNVTANGTTFVGVNDYASGASNAFAVVAFGAAAKGSTTDDVAVTITDSKLIATSEGNNKQYVVSMTNVEDIEVTVDAELELYDENVFLFVT